jgi:hypothetical protein
MLRGDQPSHYQRRPEYLIRYDDHSHPNARLLAIPTCSEEETNPGWHLVS